MTKKQENSNKDKKPTKLKWREFKVTKLKSTIQIETGNG